MIATISFSEILATAAVSFAAGFMVACGLCLYADYKRRRRNFCQRPSKV